MKENDAFGIEDFIYPVETPTIRSLLGGKKIFGEQETCKVNNLVIIRAVAEIEPSDKDFNIRQVSHKFKHGEWKLINEEDDSVMHSAHVVKKSYRERREEDYAEGYLILEISYSTRL